MKTTLATGMIAFSLLGATAANATTMPNTSIEASTPAINIELLELTEDGTVLLNKKTVESIKNTDLTELAAATGNVNCQGCFV